MFNHFTFINVCVFYPSLLCHFTYLCRPSALSHFAPPFSLNPPRSGHPILFALPLSLVLFGLHSINLCIISSAALQGHTMPFRNNVTNTMSNNLIKVSLHVLSWKSLLTKSQTMQKVINFLEILISFSYFTQ